VTTNLDCLDSDQGGCEGDVNEYRSRSGATVSARCVAHQRAHAERVDEIYADVNRRYPGFDNPHSVAPEWLDPTYAGEQW